jgi:hypothetical protein
MNKTKHFALLMAGLAAATAAAAQGATMPADLASEVAKARPDASIVSFKRCALGSAATDAVGFLLRAKSGKDPLSLHLATKTAEGWKISRLSTRIDYARGGTPDILSDWVSDPTQPYDIACTAIPNKETGISTANNGAFVAPFSKRAAKGLRHLCFPASQPYNSWSCFSLTQESLQPKPSFVQLNAD